MISIENDSKDTCIYHQLYEGRGDICYKDFFLSSSRLPIRFQVWKIPPGGSEGFHTHDTDENLEEIYYVIEGEARYTADSTSIDLHPGDAVIAPMGTEHSIENKGESDLRLVVIYGKATGRHQAV